MTRYKLKQNMPGIPAGTVLRLSKQGRLIPEEDKENLIRISSSIHPENYPDWFELIRDKNEYRIEYWTTKNGIGTMINCSSKLMLDNHQSQLVLQAIEELVRYINTPIPSNFRKVDESPKDKDYDDGNYISRADRARRAISGIEDETN